MSIGNSAGSTGAARTTGPLGAAGVTSAVRVKNRKIIAKLSHRSLRANRQRNIAAVLAVALTATLFTALFTVGGSMIASMQHATFQQVGTSAHGGFKFLTQEQYDTVAADPKVKDISYNIIVATATNPELQKTYTEIRYTEAKNAEWSFSVPTTGALPVDKYDLATSTAVLDALGVPHELGATVHLEFTSQGVQHAQDFTLCGFWEGNVAMGANEAFVSREYCDEVAPVVTVPLYESGSTDFSGTINPSLWFANSWDIDSQMGALKERCGFDSQVNEGVNWAYATATMDAEGIVLLVGVLLLILLSGYLIIFNVFQISVASDIRFYGLLKTIGTTGRQLKAIVRRQALTLCLFGIPLGLLIGYLIGRLLMPAIIRTTTISNGFVITASPWVFVGAAAFALLTVLISCIRPCRLAAKVSPVEAVRWTGVSEKRKKASRRTRTVSPFRMAVASLGRDKKKAAVVIASLTLSLILLNGTCTIVRGFDLDKYVENFSVADFTLTDVSLRGSRGAVAVLDGVDASTREAISMLPGLESEGSVWGRASTHTFSDEAYTRAEDIAARNAEELPSPYADENLRMLHEDHQCFDFIYGVDRALWEKLELAGGQKVDWEKFASGDYVIATAFWDTGEDAFYEPGEQVTIEFENGTSKTYTLLAIGDLPYAIGPQFGSSLDISFVLPADEYRAQMGETDALSVCFDVDDAHVADAEAWCAAYTEGEATNLTYTSRDTIAGQFRNTQRMYTLVGGSLSVVLALIGLLNFANAVVTSINMRRRELAMLQSVGMTGRQMRAMLADEGLLYAAWTVVLSLTVGSALCYALVRLITSQMWFFTWHFSVLPVLLCVPVLVAISLLVPLLCYRSFSKRSVVERLGEAE